MSRISGLMRHAAMVALFAILGACAFGNKVDYSALAPTVNVKTADTVVIGVQDRRSYVVSGEKTVQFVGLQRGGYGNPFGVHTSSGRPLADEFATSIANSLATQDRKPQVVALTVAMNREQAIAELAKFGASKILFVTLVEWKSDLYVNLRMVYDLRAVVLDRSGKMLGEHQVQGDQNLGAHLTMFPAYSTTLPAFQKSKLEELLNDPKIVQALSAPPPTPPGRRPRRG